MYLTSICFAAVQRCSFIFCKHKQHSMAFLPSYSCSSEQPKYQTATKKIKRTWNNKPKIEKTGLFANICLMKVLRIKMEKKYPFSRKPICPRNLISLYLTKTVKEVNPEKHNPNYLIREKLIQSLGAHVRNPQNMNITLFPSMCFVQFD